MNFIEIFCNNTAVPIHEEHTSEMRLEGLEQLEGINKKIVNNKLYSKQVLSIHNTSTKSASLRDSYDSGCETSVNCIIFYCSRKVACHLLVEVLLNDRLVVHCMEIKVPLIHC